MRLAALLREIESSPGASTVADLAARLDTTPDAITAMLAALRASGRIGPDARPGTDECAATGSCGVSCTGPSRCPFVVDVGSTLEIRRR